jgi:uracil-DNA glycosylase
MEQLPSIIHISWHKHLQPLFDDPKMQMIRDEILPNCKFYPSKSEIFRVFEMPLDRIKVVILGQDPYFNGQANGFAFAINQKPIPTSLRIIRQEVINNIGDMKANPDLLYWFRQGVFLLNTALTVEAGKAGSHINYWQWFTREIVKIISLYTTNRPVWLMWGAKAKSYIGFMNNYYKYYKDILGVHKTEYNYVLECDHPAAESYPNARQSSTKFSGSEHFKICNELLKLKGQEQIDW